MPPSYRLVNYALRPGKAVERRMLCDLFRRLEPFARTDAYRYVGFGSIYFSDFLLFHQLLHISDMVSIEKDQSNFERFNFNIPFRCVTLAFGHSNIVLPKLTWSKPTIAWLDYDGKLSAEVLADIATFCSKSVSGSLLLISVNVEPDRGLPGTSPADEAALRIQNLTQAVGEDKVPLGVTGADLRGAGFASVCRRIIDNEIRLQLGQRNGPLHADSQMCYQQIVHLSYADEAQMLTVGGIIYEKRHQTNHDNCGFQDLEFVSRDDKPFRIRAPKFTQREIRFLNSKLPQLATEKVVLPGVPESDVTDYTKIYRFYPSFSEVLLG